MRCYHHPLDEVLAEQIHTPQGVMSLVDQSHLFTLLRELESDGHDVSGAAAELVALVNYATSARVSLEDMRTHLDYCVELIRKQIR